MRYIQILIFLSTFLLTIWLASSTPINPKGWLINRPTVPSKQTDMDEKLLRYKRQGGVKTGVKGHKTGVPLTELDKNLRKGEYVCGNKICKLKVGQIPCRDHLCQYPIGLGNLE